VPVAQWVCPPHLLDKAHTDPGRQSQTLLRLRERELFAGGADGLAQLL
jgi:hypothetical protein